MSLFGVYVGIACRMPAKGLMMAKTWFEELTGIADESPKRVYDCLSIDGGTLVSNLNGWRAQTGTLTLPSLGDLRATVALAHNGPMTLQ